MKNIKLFLILILGLVMYGCGKEDTEPNITVEIGDSYESGIIFYLDETGQHGRLCSPENLGGSTWSGAKSACESYEGGGHTDWELPSRSDLNQMYGQLHLNDIGSFENNIYWSSSIVFPQPHQTSQTFAWAKNFSDGSQDYFDVDFYNYVRAVRAF